jgi:hypothetical protein
MCSSSLIRIPLLQPIKSANMDQRQRHLEVVRWNCEFQHDVRKYIRIPGAWPRTRRIATNPDAGRFLERAEFGFWRCGHILARSIR